MTCETFPSTPYLRQLTAANGWRRDLIPDRHGDPLAIVAVRVGPRWTDSVAIEGENRCIAFRHPTRDDGVILPTESPVGSAAVWRRDGQCEEVLAELLDLPTE